VRSHGPHGAKYGPAMPRAPGVYIHFFLLLDRDVIFFSIFLHLGPGSPGLSARAPGALGGGAGLPGSIDQGAMPPGAPAQGARRTLL